MKVKLFSFTLLLGLVTLVSAASDRVIGYYPYWAQYSQFTPKEVRFHTISSLHYVSLTPAGDGTLALTDEMDLANFEALTKAAAENNVSVIVVIGGADAGAVLKSLAADEALRTSLVKSAAQWATKYKIAGFELDWQNLSAEDAEAFKLLFHSLKQGLPGMVIAASVYIPSMDAYDSSLNDLDYITVFIGDKMTENESLVKPNLSLDDITSALKTLAGKGIDKDKLVPVVTLYGKSFAGATGLGSAHQGVGSGNEGFLAYKDLLVKFDTPDYKVSFDEASSSEVAVGNSETIIFSGIPSLKKIATVVKENGFGGLAVYDVSQDHSEPIVSLLVTIGLVLRPEINYAPLKKK